MAITSEATTVWTGNLKTGSGTTRLDSSKAAELSVNWKARSIGSDPATTPEELLGAAHASCFSMAFSNALAEFGANPVELQVTAAVTFDPGNGITGSHLLVSGKVENITEDDFQRIAKTAKESCPVSRALIGIPITMEATLL